MSCGNDAGGGAYICFLEIIYDLIIKTCYNDFVRLEFLFRDYKYMQKNKNKDNELVTYGMLKKELGTVVTELRGEMQGLDKKLTERNERLISGFRIWQMKIEDEMADMKERMYTKEDHARDLVWMDKAMVEIEAAREERILFQQQMLRMDDRYYDHEKRIVALEKR